MAKPQYRGQHLTVREAIARTMTSSTRCAICGQVHCPRTGKALASSWDLAHDDRQGGDAWLGPAHPYCNRSKARESPRYRGHHTQLPPSTIAAGRQRSRRVGIGDVDG